MPPLRAVPPPRRFRRSRRETDEHRRARDLFRFLIGTRDGEGWLDDAVFGCCDYAILAEEFGVSVGVAQRVIDDALEHDSA